MAEQYDLIVIGGGPGGMAAAAAAADKKRVLILEREGWGGTCANCGCIPTKALLTCSKAFADMKKFKRLGINTSGTSIDFTAIKKHQQQAAKIAALGAHKALTSAQVEMKFGTGELISPQEVRYTDDKGNTILLSAKHIIIAWGSQPLLLPRINLSERILTSDGLLNTENIPQSIIIVGASVIGIEFATFFAELGSAVTLIELLDRVLPFEDQEAAQLLHQELARLGVDIHTSTKLESLNDTGKNVTAKARISDKQFEKNADYALLCTGRQPLLYEEELKRLGIEYTNTGIKIDKNMMTNVNGVYAVGDVTGGLMLAHRATMQGKVAARHICGFDSYVYNENLIPSVVYGHPQIARIGIIQQDADVQIIKSDYSTNAVARMELENKGFVKAFFRNDKLTGATICGNNAADLISPLTLAISNGMTKKQLRQWVIPHPALSEIFGALIGD